MEHAPARLAETSRDVIAIIEHRSQSHLFNRILVLLAVTMLLVLLVPVISRRETTVDNLDVPALIVFYGLLIVTAVVNVRFGSRYATILLLVVTAPLTYATAVPETFGSLDTFLLGLLVAWVIIATIFLTLRTATIIAVAHGIGIVIFAYIAPRVFPIDIINGPLLLYAILSALVLLLAFQREQLELVRSGRLTASEFRLRTITETMRDAIVMTDVQNRIIYATPSAHTLFGAEKSVLDNAPLEAWMEYVHPEDRAGLESQLITLNDSHSGIPQEYRYLRPGKPLIWVETISSMVRDEHRHPRGFIFVSRNITERKKTEAQRLEMGIQRERFQLFQRFVNDVSHDLRTPLAVMSTSLYLLRRKLNPNDTAVVESHIESIQNQIKHLEKQLENLTALSRLQDHGARYHFEAKPLNAPLEQLAEEFRQRYSDHKINLQLDLTQVQVRIMVSQQEFMQALSQILTNALQHTPEGGTVTIRSDIQDKLALIEISDTGKGIDSKDIQHIFEPLYRVDKSRNIETGGLGLGLSVTRMVIEAHSGTIDVTSDVGSGTTFTLRVPALLEPAQFYTPASAN